MWCRRRTELELKHLGEGVKTSNGVSLTTSAEQGNQKESGEFKKLTAQEIQYRRNNHLCFKCGENYTPGHQCKYGNIHFMIADDPAEPCDSEQEQGDQLEPMDSPIEASLPALSCAFSRKTITLQGQLKSYKVAVLVGTGSSHTFIHPTFEEKILPVSTPTTPLINSHNS